MSAPARTWGVRTGRALVGAGWALGLLACGETAEVDRPIDARAADAGVDQGRGAEVGPGPDGGAEGQPCTDDAQCEGLCVDDGAGLRCATACAAGAAEPGCAEGLVCRVVEGEGMAGRAACLAPTPAPGDLGDPCADGRGCAAGLACSGDHPEGVVCARRCGADADCVAAPGAPPERCAPETVTPRVCLPADAPALACPQVPCRRPDLLCVVPEARPEDPERVAAGLCVETCEQVDAPCPSGGRCTRRVADGARFCAPQGDRTAGAGCASGGAEACAPGLTCTARWPGDARAICAAECEAAEAGACGEGFACRRPAGASGTWCLPAPFGVGDATGDAGAACGAHGPTDCRPELDCVAGPDGPVCAAPCGPEGQCAVGAACLDRRLDGAYCLPGAGSLGGACDARVACTDGACHAPPSAGGDPDARRCARLCDAAAPDPGCAADERCRDGACTAAPEGMAPVGATCGDDLPACGSGLCVADPADGRPRCTAACVDDRCDADFVCRAVGDRRFCFPEAGAGG